MNPPNEHLGIAREKEKGKTGINSNKRPKKANTCVQSIAAPTPCFGTIGLLFGFL